MAISDSDWIDLVQRVTALETRVVHLADNDIPHICAKLDWIQERLNRGNRPTWTMTAIVAFLSSLSIGLIVAMMR